MNLKTAVKDYQEILEKNKERCYGGNGDGAVLRAILDDFCQLLTGIRFSGIDIKTDWHVSKNGGYTYKYDLIKGGKYQYNYFTVDKDFELESIDGDAERQIRKLFSFIKHYEQEYFFEWFSTLSMMVSIGYYWDCDERDAKSSYHWDGHISGINEKTRSKYMKMNDIHKKLLMMPNDEIEHILTVMLPAWEAHRFERGGFLDGHFSGTFSNDKIPSFNLSSSDNEIIIFPGEGRGAICSEYLVTYDIDEILKKPLGEIITLKNSRKGSKPKNYKILEHKADFATAVKDEKTGKVEFITDLSLAENSYDALFSCNKMVYRGWFNKRCKLIKNKKS